MGESLIKEARTEYRRRLKEQRRKDYSFTAAMRNTGDILEVENLETWFYSSKRIVKAVDGVSFNIPEGKTVGLVGESGCGKSVTSLSVMRLLEEPKALIHAGAIRFKEKNGETVDLARAPENKMESIRGTQAAMIFQEPMTSLNPVFSIGNQLDECVSKNYPQMKKAERRDYAVSLLKKVGISRESVLSGYPYELSGGMRQRIMIAMALAGSPRLLIADEPTTALDVTIQAQILELIRKLKDESLSSVLLITHDLGVIAQMADYVAVMYAGRIVEMGSRVDIFDNPVHPYTVGLMKAKPHLHQHTKRLYAIPGSVPEPWERPRGCFFCSRCACATDKCRAQYPETKKLSDTHAVSCCMQ